MKSTHKISIIVAALAALCSCAKVVPEGANEANQRVFEAWISINAPDAQRTGRGIYELPEFTVEGTGAAVEKDGKIIPKIKLSENVEKITNPGFKTLYRLFDKENHKALADVMTLDGETIPEVDGYEIFDPNAIWKKKKLSNFYAKNIRVQIFDKGECVYKCPSIEEVRSYCKEQMDTLWDETLRFENPQTYYVDLSKKLWDMKSQLLEEMSVR